MLLPKKELYAFQGNCLCSSGLVILASAAIPVAQEPVVRVAADKLKWVSNPEDLGFSQAIVEGDPANRASTLFK
jgi:hypothetical protein